MLIQMQEMNSQMLELELRVRDVEAENARLQTELDARHFEKVQSEFHISRSVMSEFCPHLSLIWAFEQYIFFNFLNISVYDIKV